MAHQQVKRNLHEIWTLLHPQLSSCERGTHICKTHMMSTLTAYMRQTEGTNWLENKMSKAVKQGIPLKSEVNKVCVWNHRDFVQSGSKDKASVRNFRKMQRNLKKNCPVRTLSGEERRAGSIHNSCSRTGNETDRKGRRSMKKWDGPDKAEQKTVEISCY